MILHRQTRNLLYDNKYTIINEGNITFSMILLSDN